MALFRLDSRNYERNRRSRARSTSTATAARCAVVWRGVSVLVKARIHFVWRTDRPDRDHANRAGRKEKMDQPIAISARLELLHVAARPGGATTRDLHRLAPAQNPRRRRGWRAFRDSVNFCALDAELHLRCVWKFALDRGDFLWTQTGGDRNRARRGHSHRSKSAQERSHVDARRARVCRDLFFESAVSRDRARGGRDRIPRRRILEK